MFGDSFVRAVERSRNSVHTGLRRALIWEEDKLATSAERGKWGKPSCLSLQYYHFTKLIRVFTQFTQSDLLLLTCYSDGWKMKTWKSFDKWILYDHSSKVPGFIIFQTPNRLSSFQNLEIWKTIWIYLTKNGSHLGFDFQSHHHFWLSAHYSRALCSFILYFKLKGKPKSVWQSQVARSQGRTLITELEAASVQIKIEISESKQIVSRE